MISATASAIGRSATGDQRVEAGDVDHQHDRDRGQRELVGQQPLVEVRRQQQHQDRRVRPEDQAQDRVGEPQRERRRSRAPRSTTTTGVRQSIGADGPVLVLGPACRDAVGDEAPDPAGDGQDHGERRDGHGSRTRPESTGRSARRAVPRRSGCRCPRQRELDERRVGDPGRAARRVRVRLAEVAGAADVEVGPRHGPELLEEQAALDERAVGRARCSGCRRTSSPSRSCSRG